MELAEALAKIRKWIEETNADPETVEAFKLLRNWVTMQIAQNMRIDRILNGEKVTPITEEEIRENLI